MDNVAHHAQIDGWSVERLRGAYLQHRRTTFQQQHGLLALTYLWDGFLRHGRPSLRALGDHAVASIELAPSFAIADLVIGNTIVEVKASTLVDEMDYWLNQLIGYLLLDRHDTLAARQIGTYLGWHAQLQTIPVHELLRTASAGATPNLAALRQQCVDALRDDLDNALISRLSRRYPRPLI
jgi:hypothetical protein